jgi:DNA mismatch repair protein MutS
MLRQYQAIKQQYPDVILLFRLGDFYECFNEDAHLVSRECNLVLTGRPISKGERMPMCGVPHHAIERYLARLVKKGYKCAICEQMETPKPGKLVRREITRVVSKGTIVEDSMLDAKANNFLAAIAIDKGSGFSVLGSGEKQRVGLALVDVSTGDFIVTEVESLSKLREEFSRWQPAECLVPKALANDETLHAALDLPRTQNPEPRTLKLTPFDLDNFSFKSPYQKLIEHFGVTSLRGFGCEEMPLAIAAAAATLDYLRTTQLAALTHIRGITTYSTDQFMLLDAATRRNLELTRSLRDGSTHGTLLELLDQTVTRMGSRLLRQWLLQPLLDVTAIQRRHEAVQELADNALLRGDARALLDKVYDVERLTSRAATGTANAKDLVALRNSLRLLPELLNILQVVTTPLLNGILARLDPMDDVRDLLDRALLDDPPFHLNEGGLIRDGYNEQLDELRGVSKHGKDWIAQLEETERQRTGIKSLKVGFNQVFGYYIEVTKPNLNLVPSYYIRKQTTANAERFITPDLKEWESKVLGAEEKIVDLEYDLFCGVRQQVAAQSGRLLQTAKALAELDVLACFAEVAVRHHYVRPEVNDGDAILIKAGRHPVVESTQTEPFVPNDVLLDCTENQLHLITGPNMSGKTVFLRQIALIALLAQIGSFVPAESATIGIVDRIFTRVGAQDDIATGQSTFMVEMNETANILHNATRKSLILLDEIGRGTSTYDGLSIAWAVTEYLHELGAKTLFATHYHHLNDLEEQLPRVKNYRAAVKEEGDHVTFLHRIVQGGTDKSYGIQVARLAGLPPEVIERAKQVLQTLESDSARSDDFSRPSITPPVQLKLFDAEPHPIVEELKSLDLDEMTPIQALNKLNELKKRVEG